MALTHGVRREDMISTGLALREIDPSRVPERDCRFFAEQPFALQQTMGTELLNAGALVL